MAPSAAPCPSSMPIRSAVLWILVGSLLLNGYFRPVFGQESEPTTATRNSSSKDSVTTAATFKGSSSANNNDDAERLFDEMLNKSQSNAKVINGESIATDNLGMTLGDLEDLNSDSQIDNTLETAKADAEAAAASAMAADVQDSRNIFKVARFKTSGDIGRSMPIGSNTSSLLDNAVEVIDGSFEIYKELFNQAKWDSERISKAGLPGKCARDMRIFLDDLRQTIPWAMQASDQSGRYRGMYFYGNEFWVGNEMFCREINERRITSGNAVQHHQPELEFFAGTFVVSIPQRTVYNKPTTQLQLGQCLPITCSVGDVGRILLLDPAAQQLNASGHANITLQNVRTVPGPYRLLNDSRFQLLCSILAICALFMVIATVCEWRTRTQPQSLSSASMKLKSSSTSNGHAYSISSLNSNLSNNNNNGSNGHLKGHPNMEFHGTTQMELHHIRQSNDNGFAATSPESTTPVSVESRKLGLFTRIVLSFGLLSNSKAILTAKKLPDESVSCIHGMRVFSMLWTIMVHTFLQAFGISENKFGRVITERGFYYQIIGNANYSVDTFFFLSGLLVTLLYLRSEESQRKAHPKRPGVLRELQKTALLFLYRYVRLTPVYFVALLCSELSLKYIYNQSVFNPGLTDHAVCPDYWWRNMLYVQNWFPFPQLCMIWSWYLANDMQFYVWAVLVLLLSTRFFKSSALLIVAFLLSSWAISATISVMLNYTLELAEPLITFGFLYDMPWTRIGPYIMGMIAGYLIFRFKEPPVVSRSFNLAMWALSVIITLLIIFGIWDGVLNVVETAFYVSLSHTGWGFALIWITLSCRWGYAPAVNRFLSLPAFLPLSRLTYCTYLIHPVTQIITAFGMQGPLHLQVTMVMTIFLGNALVSYACAFVLCVLCEAPIVRILRIFFKK